MYLTIDANNLWKTYDQKIAPKGLYRGGGNSSSAKMYKDQNGQKSVRPADFKIIFDKTENADMAYPDPTRGLSFSNSIGRLEDLSIVGKVWLLPRDAKLPEGLVINYRSIDHPLVNVKDKMPLPKLIEKLQQLEALMSNTGVTIR